MIMLLLIEAEKLLQQMHLGNQIYLNLKKACKNNANLSMLIDSKNRFKQ